jgi:septal ring factor EnvC (AmiA/AmiB activator)
LNPRFNTTTLQKGLDFRAPEGADVRSIHQGRIVHAGWFQGYGNLVIVDHGDGYFSLFAHLASLKHEVNDLVEAGEVLGTVGATGSLKGPYLYFEIRHHGEPLDPAPWLLRPQ